MESKKVLISTRRGGLLIFEKGGKIFMCFKCFFLYELLISTNIRMYKFVNLQEGIKLYGK